MTQGARLCVPCDRKWRTDVIGPPGATFHFGLHMAEGVLKVCGEEARLRSLDSLSTPWQRGGRQRRAATDGERDPPSPAAA